MLPVNVILTIGPTQHKYYVPTYAYRFLCKTPLFAEKFLTIIIQRLCVADCCRCFRLLQYDLFKSKYKCSTMT